jgi:hypothetical protein
MERQRSLSVASEMSGKSVERVRQRARRVDFGRSQARALAAHTGTLQWQLMFGWRLMGGELVNDN